MKQSKISKKKNFLAQFSEYSKEELIKELIFYQNEQRELQRETNKKLTTLVWFLVIIPIIATLILLSIS